MLHLKSVFKHTINWNKYKPETTTQNAANQYFDFLIEPSFQVVNRFFILTFNAKDNKIGHSRYSLPAEKGEYYNVLVDGRSLFDQPIKINIKTYKNIWKISTGQGDDYTTCCLLDHNYYNSKSIIKR